MLRTLRILILVMLAALAVTYLVFAENGNREPLKSVTDPEGLEQALIHRTPGLAKAIELGLTQEYVREWEIPGTGYRLRFDRVWYSSEMIYFFYHIDFADDPVTDDRIPSLSFRVSAKGTDTKWDQHAFEKHWPYEQGLVFDNRYYHRLSAYPLKSNVLEKLDNVDVIQLEQVEVTIGDQVYPMPDIEMAVEYDQTNEIVRKYEIGDTFIYGDYRFILEHLHIGTASTELYLRFETGDRDVQLFALNAILESEPAAAVDLDLSYVRQREDGGYIAVFQPFDVWPDSITFRLDGVRMVGDNKLEHEWNVDELPQANKNGRVKMDTSVDINGVSSQDVETDLVWDRVEWRDDVVHIRYRYEQNNQWSKAYERLVPAPLQDREWKKEGLHSEAMLLQVRNERGELAKIESLEHDDGGFGFALPRTFVEQSQTIRITVDKLMQERVDARVREWELEDK